MAKNGVNSVMFKDFIRSVTVCQNDQLAFVIRYLYLYGVSSDMTITFYVT